MLSSHSIVSSSRTVRPCSSWGGRWIGHWRTTWLLVRSSAPHSQAAEEATPQMCKKERKRPTPVRTWLSQTHAVLGRVILGGCAGVRDESAESCFTLNETHAITFLARVPIPLVGAQTDEVRLRVFDACAAILARATETLLVICEWQKLDFCRFLSNKGQQGFRFWTTNRHHS